MDKSLLAMSSRFSRVAGYIMFTGGNPSVLLQGTAVEGTIQQLFEGHHMNYIECINVDYKSTRKESFYGTTMQLKLEAGWRL